MTKQEFNLLSNKYLQGQCTPEEESYLRLFCADLDKDNPLSLAMSEKEEIKNRIWSKIEQAKTPKKSTKIPALSWSVGIAASILFFLVWNIYTEKNISFSTRNLEGMELKNISLVDQKVQLKDGSVVLLKPQSSLIYGKDFNLKKREVFLSGQAYFKVKRDITKPFVVHSGELNTEVLGTSFWVKSNSRKNQIEVSVTSGKVSVYSNKSNDNQSVNGVILTRNQKVIYDVISKNINSTIVDNPTAQLSHEFSKGQLIFQSAPLQSVLSTMSKHYGVEIISTNPNSNDCLITADLNGLPMYTQLDLICKSIAATYEKRGTAIFITGEGCN